MNVIIRPLQETDAYTSVKWRNDKEVFKYTGNTYENTVTIDSELDWINRVIKNKNEYRCAIEVDGVYVGNIYLTDIEKSKAQYHIFIGDKEYWGKGIASLASKKILHYAFNVLNLNLVYLDVHRLNGKALALYEKLGFVAVNTCDSLFLRMEINRKNFYALNIF